MTFSGFSKGILIILFYKIFLMLFWESQKEHEFKNKHFLDSVKKDTSIPTVSETEMYMGLQRFE